MEGISSRGVSSFFEICFDIPCRESKNSIFTEKNTRLCRKKRRLCIKCCFFLILLYHGENGSIPRQTVLSWIGFVCMISWIELRRWCYDRINRTVTSAYVLYFYWERGKNESKIIHIGIAIYQLYFFER